MNISNYRMYRTGQAIIASGLLLLVGNSIWGVLESLGLWGSVLLWGPLLGGGYLMYRAVSAEV